MKGAAPAGAGLIRVIRLLSGEEVEALLIVGSAQQSGLPSHCASALCGGQGALGLDALLGDALVQGYSQEALCVLYFAQDAGYPVRDQIHHLQSRLCIVTGLARLLQLRASTDCDSLTSRR